MEPTRLLTQDTESGGTTLLDAHNGFKELSRLEMIWMVCNLYPEGVMFVFN